MAYMNQERKATIAAALKKVVPAGWKYSLAVRNHSTIVFTLTQAPVDILGNIREALNNSAMKNGMTSCEAKTYWDVNPYCLERQFSGSVLKAMLDISAALNQGNWDKSDIQTDYFDVGWYVDLKIGRWNDPFLDTVPVEQRTKSGTVKATTIAAQKPARDELKPYLPYGWITMSPGKKAHATKVAMRKYQEAQSA